MHDRRPAPLLDWASTHPYTAATAPHRAGLLVYLLRRYLGPTWFGLAAAMKCTALLWVPYLVWRGRPAAAAWVMVVALGVNLLPDAVSTPPSGRPWLGEYAVRYLRPLASSEHVLGT